MGALNQYPGASARGKDESHITVPHPYLTHQIQEPHTTLVAVQKESEGLPTPADQSESVSTIFYRDDFVLLTDDMECSMWKSRTFLFSKLTGNLR